MAVSVVVLDALLDENSAAVPHSSDESSMHLVSNVHLMSDDDKACDVELMDSGQALDCNDVFYDTNLFTSADLDDTDLLSGLSLGVSAGIDLLSVARPGIDLLADCEPLLNDGNGESVQQGNGVKLEQLLSEAGIQQPAERQIRLHSELVQHLSDDSMLARPDSMLVKPQTTSSSESELVRMLTSALEDASSMAQLLPQKTEPLHVASIQHVPVMSLTSADMLTCNADVSADSELVRQLNLSTDDAHVAGSSHYHLQRQQPHQRVALVQPTVARPLQTHTRPLQTADVKSSLNFDRPQLVVHQPQMTVNTQLGHSVEQPQTTLPANSIQQIIQSTMGVESTQPVPVPAPMPRQIVITTQAPVQSQQVPQISLQQLQQVMLIHRPFIYIASI